VIAQRWVALSLFVPGSTECYALIQENVVANLSGFPDYYARAVVDEEPPPDGSARMNLDARQKPAELRNNPRQQRHFPLVQPVGDPVQQDSVQTGVAEDNLERALSGRIPLEYGIDLLFYRAKHRASSMVPNKISRNKMVSRESHRAAMRKHAVFTRAALIA
jgi:hypothetical protein